MNLEVTLTITSLLSILLGVLHLTDDIVRWFERGVVGGRIANSSGKFLRMSTLLMPGVWHLQTGRPL